MEVTLTIPDDVASEIQNGATTPLARRLLELAALKVIEDDEQDSVASIATWRYDKSSVAEGDEYPVGKVRRLQRRTGSSSVS